MSVHLTLPEEEAYPRSGPGSFGALGSFVLRLKEVAPLGRLRTYRPSAPGAGAVRGSGAGLWTTGSGAGSVAAPEGPEPNVRCAITMSTNRAASPTAMFFSCQLTLVEYPTPPRARHGLLSASARGSKGSVGAGLSGELPPRAALRAASGPYAFSNRRRPSSVTQYDARSPL
jgi:hypothetical protein